MDHGYSHVDIIVESLILCFCIICTGRLLTYLRKVRLFLLEHYAKLRTGRLLGTSRLSFFKDFGQLKRTFIWAGRLFCTVK